MFSLSSSIVLHSRDSVLICGSCHSMSMSSTLLVSNPCACGEGSSSELTALLEQSPPLGYR